MKYLYLRYRASIDDDWTNSPAFPTSAPTTPDGAIPIAGATIATGPETLTPCGCPDDSDPSTYDDHLALEATSLGLAEAEAEALVLFLLYYKDAALHESKYAGYLTSDFLTATVTRVRQISRSGLFYVSLRLAAPNSTVTSL